MTLCAQNHIVESLNKYGSMDEWSIRSVKESGIIGGRVKYLYEFFGDRDTVETREPFSAPEGYYWRTNNVLAVVAGVTKTNNTVFPEERDGGYCARIETHIESVKAVGIVNMDVVCQGAFILGSLPEPIRNTKDPMAKVLYGIPFEGRPEALVYDFKADVGHEAVRGTGFAKLKPLGYPDYPEIAIILQKRWEDGDGNVHALRVGSGYDRIMENVTEWKNGHRLEVHYGDISGEPFYEDYMGLMTDPDRAFHTINSKGENVTVLEEGWASADEQPNFMIIKFLSSCGQAFYGGVGNILWVDNIHLEM
ncbi:MAG: PCMD domain-containing protein [Bacteroidetes bacterium]|uniref:PCMD domain-containing protein n=1 Tax=Candidatus Cryptobacteroides merdavium TaxID=2840769 RepID=A0A9D9HDT9_9BACT|nr:PCMD domain-containing protein [Candidatus Cryptobacteroides merdavium]